MTQQRRAGWQSSTPFVTKALSGYRAGVRAEVRGLWLGQIDRFTFVDDMVAVIRRGMTQAWGEGARECGITLAELTQAERDALELRINNQFGFLPGLAGFVEANSQANGGKLRTVFRRAETWINQYNSARNKAKLMACQDQKLQWQIDPEKDNCNSCLKLNGKVKRASTWREAGIEPQNPPNDRLECGGWLCGCRLVPTDAPLTPGPLPALP